jgi:2-hydroxycyclohexanecarboxyl-CoA dehydrogenase
MVERRFGRIVIVSSESWRVGIAFGLTNYATAKAAALGFMRQLAHEVGRKGVTVNAVSLGTMNNFGYEEQAKATAVGTCRDGRRTSGRSWPTWCLAKPAG